METEKKSSDPELKLYKCFGSPKRAFVIGHLFKSKKLKKEKVSNNIFKNAWEMLKRYRVAPAPFELLNIEFEQQTFQIETDQKGYFMLEFTPQGLVKDVPFSVSLKKNPKLRQHGTVEICDAKHIFISDIDDTILVSHSTSWYKKIFVLLSRNFERRRPFDGVQEFYHSLYNSSQNQLFFYVSSSEWNLYDFIENFCRHHGFPKGYFLLNDIKSGLRQLIKSGGGTHNHKLDKIRRIRDTYAGATFTLIGDSGQKDAEIYEQIALEKPERISEIFIRDLHKNKHKHMQQVKKRLAEKAIQMHLFN